MDQPTYMGERRRHGAKAHGVVDWGDGCQYQGAFFGFMPQGYGVFRFDLNPDDQRSDDVINGCCIEGCFLNNMVRRAKVLSTFCFVVELFLHFRI